MGFVMKDLGQKRRKNIQLCKAYLSINRRPVKTMILRNEKKATSQFEQHIHIRRRKYMIIARSCKTLHNTLTFLGFMRQCCHLSFICNWCKRKSAVYLLAEQPSTRKKRPTARKISSTRTGSRANLCYQKTLS